MENNELYHYGVKGMKWGVRKRRPSTSSNNTKRTANKKKISNKRLSFFKKKTVTKPTTDEKEDKPDSIEVKKQKILKSRSAKELYKNANLFTDQELQSAYDRLNLERKIASLSPEEVSKGEQYVDNVVKWGRKANDLVDVGSKGWNNFAKLYNTFSENGKKNPLPIINNGDGGKKKK